MSNCCYVAVYSAARGASVPTGGGEGWGISWRPPAYSLLKIAGGQKWTSEVNDQENISGFIYMVL